MNPLNPQDQLYQLISNVIKNNLTGKIDNFEFNSIRLINGLPITTQKFVVCIEVRIPNGTHNHILQATEESLAKIANSLAREYETLLFTQGMIEISKTISNSFIIKEKAPVRAEA